MDACKFEDLLLVWDIIRAYAESLFSYDSLWLAPVLLGGAQGHRGLYVLAQVLPQQHQGLLEIQLPEAAQARAVGSRVLLVNLLKLANNQSHC